VPRWKRYLMVGFTVVCAPMGVGFLVAAALSAVDSTRFRDAPPCEWPAKGRCLGETEGRIAQKLALTFGKDRDEYLVDVVVEGHGRRRASLVRGEDYELVAEGENVRLRAYRGEIVALVRRDGTDLETVDHPSYAWASRLAIGYCLTSFGAFALYMLVVTRGSFDSRRLGRSRLGMAGPFFVLPGAAALLADTWFEASPRTLVVLTVVATAITAAGGTWIALRPRA
jgi:hypothetical protein